MRTCALWGAAAPPTLIANAEASARQPGELMPLSHRVSSFERGEHEDVAWINSRVTAAWTVLADQPRRETEPKFRLAKRQPAGNDSMSASPPQSVTGCTRPTLQRS